MNVLLLIFCISSLLHLSSAATFTETGECREKYVCKYLYSAQQDYSESNAEHQYTQMNATVEVTCLAVGQYNGSGATLYCMDVRDVTIDSTLLKDSSAKEKNYTRKLWNEHLSKWFCFLQSSSGKVPAVYHDVADLDDAVSFKKAITAAFQANFQGTTEEEEMDPVSEHTSHYTYLKSEGKLKMNRTILKEDIKEYSASSKRDDIESIMKEELEYRNGRLERSKGHMVIHMTNNSNSLDSDKDEKKRENFTLSQAFSASGHYQLEVQECKELSANSLKSLRKIMGSRIKQSVTEGLKVNHTSKMTAYENMKELRRKLPSGSVSAGLLNYKTYDQEKLEDVLVELMELESRYGVLPTYQRAIDDLIAFMDKEVYSKDREVRELVADLLTSESSLSAQMALLTAFDRAVDEAEANAILIHLSFLESVDIQLIVRLEDKLNTSFKQSIRDQLLLVYGSLAVKGDEEVEYRVVDNLVDKVMAYQYAYSNTSVDIILMALGNTGSKLSIEPILSFLNMSGYFDVDIMLKVIDALSKVTDDMLVLTKLNDLVQAHPSVYTLSAVIESLQSGLEYINTKASKRDYLAKIRTHPLLSTLASEVSMNNDSVLYNMTVKYFITINVSQEIFDILHSISSSLSRSKRYTTDWDSSDSDYNNVASIASRTEDVKTYGIHKAYLNSKRLGIDDAHMKVVSGLFAGTTRNCDKMKVFGRVLAIGKVRDRSVTAADAKFDLRLTTSSAYVTAHVKIGGNSLLNLNETRSLSSNCWARKKNIVQLRVRLMRFRFRIFVYVGRITLGLDLYFKFNLDLNSNICIGRTGTEVTGALGAITPTAGLEIQGSVSASLLSTVRGGITATCNFQYSLEPAASVQACSYNCGFSWRRCIGVYDSFPNNYINIRTWYQTRKVSFCGRWIKYPCIKWGRQHTWDTFTHTWRLGSSSRKKVWQQCSGNLHSVCAAGALSSPLFSYK